MLFLRKHLSSIALVGGFIFDILTLRRADTLWENFWIVLHLLIVATMILLLSRREGGTREDSRLDFWLVNLMQFSFGGLLSAFLILYFRSATLSVSWPFLLILALAFAANERLKQFHERLVFQIAFFYLSLFSFAIFFVPVLAGSISSFAFILSGIVSLVLIRYFLKILRRVSAEKYFESKSAIRKAVAVIFVLINVLYFLNIIPPIPLSLKDGGVYHSLVRDANGNYILEREKKGFFDYFRIHEVVHVTEGKPLFAYTSVFSPARFNIDIIHEWETLTPGGEWESIARIPLSISGGRDTGFRTYSISSVTPGKWRVSVLTLEGRVLGRINFQALKAEEELVLVPETR
jgi:hypothetical protein